jgi:hypothetical protein
MSHPRYTSEEIVRRGQEIYEEQIRAEVEAEHTGKFLVVDIETGMYEIDASELVAFDRVLAKHPDAALYLLRIGHDTAYRIGGKAQVMKP